MAIIFDITNELNNTETEFKLDEMKKKLQYSMANFAQIKYKRAMESRMTVLRRAK